MQLPGKVTYFLLLSLAFSAVGFVVHLVSLCTPFWRTTSVDGAVITRTGLWKICHLTMYGFVCVDIPKDMVHTMYRSVQGSVLIALLFILVSGVATTASSAMARENFPHTNLVRFSAVVSLFAVISLLVSSVLYWLLTNTYKKKNVDPNKEKVEIGWSLQLEILSAALLFFAAFMSLIHIRVKDLRLRSIANQRAIHVRA